MCEGLGITEWGKQVKKRDDEKTRDETTMQDEAKTKARTVRAQYLRGRCPELVRETCTDFNLLAKERESEEMCLPMLFVPYGTKDRDASHKASSCIDAERTISRRSRWVKGSGLHSAKSKKQTGRKQVAPKSRATILPSRSFMKLARFMSDRQRRRPNVWNSGMRPTRSDLPTCSRICVERGITQKTSATV